MNAIIFECYLVTYIFYYKCNLIFCSRWKVKVYTFLLNYSIY
jgi:hypothetical protein